MSSENFVNDAPIELPEDDQFGINEFAQALALSIREIHSPVGITIAINGQWGSGKSSAVNLIRHHLIAEIDEGRLDIVDFRCWWFRGEEALTLAFMQELDGALKKSLGDKAKELIPLLGKKLLQAGPIVGQSVNVVTGGLFGGVASSSIDFVEKFFHEEESVETLFRTLAEALESQDKRFLVLIDDLDRLTPDELILVFRLIKSVGRLPNVMYLLAFDRELAENVVKDRYPSEGPHFLEKIVQACFELPTPPRDDLNRAALSQIEALCKPDLGEDQLLRFMNIYYDAVSPYLSTPRDLTRLCNAMAVSWPPIAGEVNIADYVALEVMRLFEPKLHYAIRENRERVCGVGDTHSTNEDEEGDLESFLQLLPEQRRGRARAVLARLFPRLDGAGYSPDFLQEWKSERLVCTERHFDTYFRMSIGEELISASFLDCFLDNCGDKEYVKQAFREAIESVRKNGKSKVPLLLDEINIYTDRIEKPRIPPLVSAIFQIADEIDREEDRDKGGFTFGDNHRRIHWLIRKLLLERFQLDERTEIFLAACENAQIGWLVDFTRSAIGQHFPREGGAPKPLEECLLNKEGSIELRSCTTKKIEAEAVTGQLLYHGRLGNILFRWRDFAENGSTTVKTWTNEQLGSDVSVALLAKAFTGESWSQGMGMFGLGDRVAMRHSTADLGSLESIVDTEAFRKRLEGLEESGSLKSPHKEYIEVFLNALRSHEAGDEW